MPSRDGTGPYPERGKGAGRGGQTRPGAGPSGSCACPTCGRSLPHRRGVPCSEMVCPKCGTPMTRK